MARTAGRGTDEAGTQAPARERRYVYGGSPAPEWTPGTLRPNRRATRRKVSTFNIIILLFGIGGAIVFYINNILSINRLSSEVGQREADYQKIEGINASLRTEVSRKSALEHISPAAQDLLGLHAAQTQQIWFTIDRDKLNDLGVAGSGSHEH